MTIETVVPVSTPAQVRVPFLDLARIHEPLSDELTRAFSELVASGQFVNGEPVLSFESAFADYCASAHCVGVASGLDALRLGLLAKGIGEGDEVIVPANTFAASVEAIVQAGATPVLVDVSDSDFLLDPDSTRQAVTDRTAAIMPVDLYGQMVDAKWLAELAAEHALFIVEDACQAHGAVRGGIRAGNVGDVAAFSFYPGKNLGAMGDAGAVVCRDEELADRVRAIREHGQLRKYEHAFVGYTARLDALQAQVLLTKLRYLDEWNDQRRAIAVSYAAGLDDLSEILLPTVAEGSLPVWHLYVIRAEDPVALGTHLDARGISTGRHYPEPLHLSPAFRHLGHARGDFPVAERLSSSVLSLPMFPGMTEAEVDAVISAVREFFGL